MAGLQLFLGGTNQHHTHAEIKGAAVVVRHIPSLFKHFENSLFRPGFRIDLDATLFREVHEGCCR